MIEFRLFLGAVVFWMDSPTEARFEVLAEAVAAVAHAW